MSNDDYIVEDEDEGGGRRPFLIAVTVLTSIFILAAVCSLIYLFANRQTTNPQATAIAATNAVILITNEAVTVAIQATETAQAMPTNTPEPTLPATATANETPDTPALTETAVVSGDGSVTPNVSGTSEFEDGTGTPGSDDGGTAVAGGSATRTPLPAATSSGNNAQALPETGLDTWGVLLAGLVLLLVLFAARRLRST